MGVHVYRLMNVTEPIYMYVIARQTALLNWQICILGGYFFKPWATLGILASIQTEYNWRKW